MIIGVEINDVIRNFTGRFAEVYSKYELPNEERGIDLEENPITDHNFHEYFLFKDVNSFNDYLYTQAAMEINGLAPELHEHSMTKLNALNLDLLEDEEHEIWLISREANLSCPSTLFFLSKLSTKIKTIKFYTQYENLWDDVDMVIGAHPKTLESRPEGKISVKVKTTYNKETEADFVIDNIIDFTDNEELRDEILNNVNA